MKSPGLPPGGLARPAALAAFCAGLGLCGPGLPAPAAAGAPAAPAPAPAVSRCDRPPRKVLLGTAIGGEDYVGLALDRRLQRMDELVGAMAAEAASRHPGRPLDLALLPEFFLGRPGDLMAQESVALDEILPRVAQCARRNGTYLIVPVLLREADPPLRYSNAAVLVDRAGRLVGTYRKVHPVVLQDSDVIEGGTTPGRDFPVFDCDFGRVGIQICFDMLYADGWRALARRGAEIVAVPSASPETVHPALYALEHGYYVVTATPRAHAAVFNPLGIMEAQITKPSVLVHEIDLSYAILHWEAVLENGEALTRRFGDRVGYHYFNDQDGGIFWSNDPDMTIGQMIRSIGLAESDANVERVRRLDDKARGGPPAAP